MIQTILNQSSILGILALGMFIVLLCGGIDLSIGATVALSSVLTVLYPFLLPSIVAGIVIGLSIGLLVVYANIRPFVVTLGAYTVIRGLALIVSDGKPVYNELEFIDNIANYVICGIPTLPIIYFAYILFIVVIMRGTLFGMLVRAIGSSEEYSRNLEVPVDKIKIISYVLSSFSASIAGILLASRTSCGSPDFGQGYELEAIAICVIGGVSLSGAYGRIYCVVLATLVISAITVFLGYFGISPHYQYMVKGLLIVAIVLLRRLFIYRSIVNEEDD